jgi:hypothetical protein
VIADVDFYEERDEQMSVNSYLISTERASRYFASSKGRLISITDTTEEKRTG